MLFTSTYKFLSFQHITLLIVTDLIFVFTAVELHSETVCVCVCVYVCVCWGGAIDQAVLKAKYVLGTTT